MSLPGKRSAPDLRGCDEQAVLEKTRRLNISEPDVRRFDDEALRAEHEAASNLPEPSTPNQEQEVATPVSDQHGQDPLTDYMQANSLLRSLHFESLQRKGSCRAT
eukprot:CAMPEP_0117657330 /NCGR_PEP_ID=MMETSP0804-20121206/5273_1 /TAXON_ID=1074897 /ORGANISM="Tetraselmis astigmatica, Strain CCMP880" /LENGTH=104 /DNA_ID=CAMNT_0005463777 /DNA_START=465 /DNA_END=779 /DNA_ORIENTATION=+